MTNSILYSIITLNLAVFFLYAWDKFLAIMHWRRVSERALILAAVPFSAVGAFLGMFFFRHKTRKHGFQLWVAALLLVQLVIIVAVSNFIEIASLRSQ